MFSLRPIEDKRFISYCYSSEVVKENNIKSINFSILVEEEQGDKWINNLLEYLVKWEVDHEDKFLRWEQPQLIASSKLFGIGQIFDEIKPFW